MKLDNSLEPFRAVIEALQRLLGKVNEQGVIIGGIAVGFLGQPRFTADIDAVFLLSTQDIPQFLDLAQEEDIFPRISDAADFARKNRVLLLQHRPTEIDVDISLGILPFEEEMVKRASTRSFAGLAIRLPTPEDLIIMKAVARRPKDLDDIRTIGMKYPALDKSRVEKWVKSFGEALDVPNLWDQIEPLLSKTS
ncbi:MAG TPA: nucleotidyl transferase AbiEii/AbiGii toxin family protein [Anaerolineales bacterium]|nr:nucleotidyl transferase AbiEii/AbiGii toxin family protein [Anaerolineales bacterium]